MTLNDCFVLAITGIFLLISLGYIVAIALIPEPQINE